MKKSKHQKKQHDENDFFSHYMELVKKEQAIADQLKEMEPDLLKKKNLVGYGVGFKSIRGVYVHEICAVFFVKEKTGKKQLSKKDLFPEFIMVKGKKVRTDVVELMGRKQAAALGDPTPNRVTCRPVEMGTSIRICQPGNDTTVAAGTAGALVKEKLGPNRFLLSAGHVFTAVGNDVVQPETGTNVADRIGAVVAVAGTNVMAGVDAGTAEIVAASASIISIGIPNPAIKPVVGLNVQKSGMFTGLTQSSIYYTNVTMLNVFLGLISNPPYPATSGLFFVQNASPNVPHPLNPFPSFAFPGDSGALIVAGWPGDPTNYGHLLAQTFAILSLQPNGAATIDAMRKKLDRAALGLLLEIVSVPLQHANGTLVGALSFAVGQEIGMALSALNVDLITR